MPKYLQCHILYTDTLYTVHIFFSSLRKNSIHNSNWKLFDLTLTNALQRETETKTFLAIISPVNTLAVTQSLIFKAGQLVYLF